MNISVSRDRRHLAASRERSLRFSLFLQREQKNKIIIKSFFINVLKIKYGYKLFPSVIQKRLLKFLKIEFETIKRTIDNRRIS